MLNEVYVGIDVGSVSTNIAAIGSDQKIVFTYYTRTNGQPLVAIKKGLYRLKDELGDDTTIAGIGTTGSGRQLAGVMVGADIVKNEITAHAVATTNIKPDVRTIFEIGGQDSKLILVKDGMVVDFAMNTVCAAGTGSFLDHQAERLGLPIDRFGEMALKSKTNVQIAGRCTVFAESDMIAKQQYGFSKADIIMGLCRALVRNFINNLGRGKMLQPPFVFQGGVAANTGIKAAFEEELKQTVTVPDYFDVMGAIGAAILAWEEVEQKGSSSFRGLDSLKTDFTPSSFICEGCANMCEVIKVEANEVTIAVWGDRCGKWKENIKQVKLKEII